MLSQKEIRNLIEAASHPALLTTEAWPGHRQSDIVCFRPSEFCHESVNLCVWKRLISGGCAGGCEGHLASSLPANCAVRVDRVDFRACGEEIPRNSASSAKPRRLFWCLLLCPLHQLVTIPVLGRIGARFPAAAETILAHQYLHTNDSKTPTRARMARSVTGAGRAAVKVH